MARSAIHPGVHLAEELKELGLSANAFSKQIGVPVNRVTAIINGQRGISADTALQLAHWFGTAPAFWLNLQNIYELRLASAEAGDSIARLPTLARRADKAEARPLLKTAPRRGRAQ